MAPQAIEALWVVRMVEEQFHRDEEGRPLREGRTPARYLAVGATGAAAIDYRACPYPGSRQAAGRVMNVSALRQTSAHWDEIVEALAWLRTAYFEARAEAGAAEAGSNRAASGGDLMDLWRVSQLGSALPWFFLLSSQPLPAFAAALSKATLGTGILAQRLLHKQLTEAWTPPPLTAPALLALAESTGTLVGETEVCSAPDRMIARFLEVLVTGVPRGGVPAVDRAIGSLFAAPSRLLGFAAAYCGFKLALWVYYLARRFLYADLVAALGSARDGDAVRALQQAPCEPPDFFVIEPPSPAAVPPALRAAWLDRLAGLIAPFAPDGSDRPVLDGARRMAAAMAPGTGDADPVARAIAAFDALDAIFGDIAAAVEAGLRGAPCPIAIDAATRDRLVAAPPRALVASLRESLRGAIVAPWT